jgi:hypothetical protein
MMKATHFRIASFHKRRSTHARINAGIQINQTGLVGLVWKGGNEVLKELQSKNDRAEKIAGRRPEGYISFDHPSELGYRCPICGYTGDNLHWSEYKYFIWCEDCNKDIPSLLCMPDNLDKGIEIFLDIIEEIKLEKEAPK